MSRTMGSATMSKRCKSINWSTSQLQDAQQTNLNVKPWETIILTCNFKEKCELEFDLVISRLPGYVYLNLVYTFFILKSKQ